MIPIKGNKNLFRDEKSGAVINTDTNGYSQYKRMKSAKMSQKEEIDNCLLYTSPSPRDS